MLRGNRGIVTLPLCDSTNTTKIIHYSENETAQWGMNLTFLLRGWPASENVFRYWELAVEWNWWPSWEVDIIITLTLMMDYHQSSPAEFVTGPGLSERAETLSMWWTVRDVLHQVRWVILSPCHMSSPFPYHMSHVLTISHVTWDPVLGRRGSVRSWLTLTTVKCPTLADISRYIVHYVGILGTKTLVHVRVRGC